MIVHVVCEGQSENAFVRRILCQYIGESTNWRLLLQPSTLVTSRDKRRGSIYRGGLLNFSQAERNILNFMASGEPVTTMFDFYRLPKDFPGFSSIDSINSDTDKVCHLEQLLGESICKKDTAFRTDYFIPYIQLHEFEALFYSDLSKLKRYYLLPEEKDAIDRLINDTNGIMPEDIDCGERSAPARRLADSIGYRKGDTVTYLLAEIGVDKMREKCLHFDQWIRKILLLS